jgi:hypothetical protein
MAALGLLVAVFAASGTTSVQAVGDGEVGWVSDSGAGIDFVTSDGEMDFNEVDFHINDDALETTMTGSATVMNVSAGTKYINLATGMAGADSNTATSTTIDFGDTVGYEGANTPLVTDALVTKIKGNFALSTEADGGITLLEAVSGGNIEVTFQFHVTDSYPGHLRDVSADGNASDAPSGSQRAKVTSTSDPQGEWVTITESDATSNMFSGMVRLSSDAASSGSAGWCTEARISHDDDAESGVCHDLKPAGNRWADGGVWVQDSDTVTVTYYDAGGATVATDSVTVDTVKPEISNISPDSGTFTRVANPTISFDVTDTGSGIDIQDLEKITLTINGREATGVSFLSIDDGIRAIYARPTSEWDTYRVTEGNGDPFPITITAKDGAGNESKIGAGDDDMVGTSDDDYMIDIDLAKPMVRTADATSKTTVVVTFDEPLDGDSLDSDGSDFEVADVLVTGAAADADDAKVVTLTVSDLAPDAKPVVSVVGKVADNAGNEVDTANDAASKVVASDSIDATITSLDIGSPLVGEDGEVGISLSFDEKLATDGLKVSVNGPYRKSDSKKLVDVARDTPLSGNATFKVGDDSLTGMYGVSVQVTDLGNNTANNLTKVEDEERSVDGATLTLKNGPIGDANFDGSIDEKDITLSDDSVMVAKVDASARTVTLSEAYDGDLKVTYHYVPAEAAFQVDVDAPTVTVEPSNESTVKDQSPFIRLVFDDDEYPGDSNTSVKLESAMLTMPDDTKEDVTEMFKAGTADNIEFIWAASDLALGEYTLTLSATDAAGNKLEDAESTFTVAKRTASIALRPGWNLISIPGSLAPDKRGVNDVFTNGAIDIVLTYDAKKRNWFRATRQADGTLGQPGSSLELSTVTSMTAYWVHSTGVVSQAVDLLGASSQEPPVSIDLVAGWNLIPVRTTEVGSDPVDADSYLSGLNWTRAYGYNNTTQVFESILPGSDATLAENNGYWLYLREAGVLVP